MASLLDRDRVPGPCVLVIFGASGDLAQRKLVPAGWQLFRQGRLPEQFALLGVARSDWTDESFRDSMRTALDEFVGSDSGSEEEKTSFLSKLYYLRRAPDNSATYTEQTRRLGALDAERGTGGNRCFYCSVPPSMYSEIAE